MPSRVKLALKPIVVDMEHVGNTKALTTRTVQSLTELPVVQSIITRFPNRLFNRVNGQLPFPQTKPSWAISHQRNPTCNVSDVPQRSLRQLKAPPALLPVDH
jgi:hypothetical protein